MKSLRLLGAATVAAALLSGSAAAALTADAVWSALQSRIEAQGSKIAVGSRSSAGGTLQLKDVTLTTAHGPTTSTVSLPELDLAEGADGKVTVTAAPGATVAIHAAPEPGKKGQDRSADVTLKLSQSGLKTVVSGTTDDLTLQSSAASVGLAIGSIVADGKPVDAKGGITFTGMESTAHITGTDPAITDASGSVQSFKLALDVANPEKKGSAHVEAEVADLKGTSHAVLPKGVDIQADMAKALAAGYSLSSALTHGPASLKVAYVSPKGPGTITGSTGTGTLTVDMSKDHLRYGAQDNDSELTLQVPDLPLPEVKISQKSGEFQLTVPIAKSDTPQDFSLLTRIIGLSVNKEVWGLFDPTGALPHTPATLIVDLAGQGKLGMDLLDPKLAEHPPMDPGQLQSLKLNQLQLTALGAELTGKGAVTFDNSGPAPRPVGDVELKLTGGNALMEKLTQMGLLPENQAAGVRMMLGMFTEPAGDDVLKTKIEFKQDGAILANGQRIQ
ncbi:DUF2125 domain-containing protein [Solirhodobacter olei]|uniref:DUF2125 domain-containing protein n=1 Tax=Solirhodobacter olei TaxID=2493082 RepID=UPI000FDB771B|nr:DUF2125 domain-containing protein [Solirhodobacter olei]